MGSIGAREQASKRRCARALLHRVSDEHEEHRQERPPRLATVQLSYVRFALAFFFSSILLFTF